MASAASTGQGQTAYAGFWRRFGTMIVDAIVIGIGGTALMFVLEAAGFAMFESAEYGAQVEELSASADFAVSYTTLGAAVWVVGQWLYVALFESSELQAAPGKLALGLRVTDLQGARIGFWRATGRNVGKIVSTLILFVGFMMAGWTKKKQAPHDMMAGCLVVSGRA